MTNGNEPQAEIEAVLHALKKPGPPAREVHERTVLICDYPEAVTGFVTAVLNVYPKGGTFLHYALSYVPDSEWRRLSRLALDALGKNSDNKAASSILEYASLQNVQSLHPLLDEIFQLQQDRSSWIEKYAWRESGLIHAEFLKSKLIEKQPKAGLRAWEALLQTRHPDLIAFALLHTDVLSALAPHSTETVVSSCLSEIGYCETSGRLQRLAPDATFHLGFPSSYFAGQSRPVWISRNHPTWRFIPSLESSQMQLGGRQDGECSVCNGPLHRLMKISPVPVGIGISGLDEIDLATCLSCLGWEHSPLFCRHESDGSPREMVYDGPIVVPQFPAEPLRECQITLAATPERWRWQNWGMSNSRENLNRLGGEPCWIQSAEYPRCPDCESLMTFLMQLDSDLPTESGGEWLWGSGGIGYVFWCDRCKISGYLWQCT